MKEKAVNMFTTAFLVGLALGARAASPAVVPSSVKFLLATPKQVVVSVPRQQEGGLF